MQKSADRRWHDWLGLNASAAVTLAAPLGALLWLAGDWVRTGAGPATLFTVAGVVGLVGAGSFYRRFGRESAGGGVQVAGGESAP